MDIEGLSAITRCPQTMAQDGKRGSIKFDSEDRFCLDGHTQYSDTGNGTVSNTYTGDIGAHSDHVGAGYSRGDAVSAQNVAGLPGQVQSSRMPCIQVVAVDLPNGVEAGDQ